MWSIEKSFRELLCIVQGTAGWHFLGLWCSRYKYVWISWSDLGKKEIFYFQRNVKPLMPTLAQFPHPPLLLPLIPSFLSLLCLLPCIPFSSLALMNPPSFSLPHPTCHSHDMYVAACTITKLIKNATERSSAYRTSTHVSVSLSKYCSYPSHELQLLYHLRKSS